MDARIETIDWRTLRRAGEGAGNGRATLIGQVLSTLQTTGFLLIGNVPEEGHDVAALFAHARGFFRLPAALKEMAVCKDRAKRGYSAIQSENFACLTGQRAPNDLVEKFRMGPVEAPRDIVELEGRAAREAWKHHSPNHWAGVSPELRASCERHYRRMEAVAVALLALLEEGLCLRGGALTECMEQHTSIMALNYYPPDLETALQEEVGEVGRGEQARPGALCMAGHTDVSLLTVLAQSQEGSGLLQIRVHQSHSCSDSAGEEEGSRWVSVPYRPHSYIVNVGDCLRDWTRGRLKSTLHRVLRCPLRASGPTAVNTGGDDRVSVAFFASPLHNALVGDSTEELRYSVWRARRIKQAMAHLR